MILRTSKQKEAVAKVVQERSGIDISGVRKEDLVGQTGLHYTQAYVVTISPTELYKGRFTIANDGEGWALARISAVERDPSDRGLIDGIRNGPQHTSVTLQYLTGKRAGEDWVITAKYIAISPSFRKAFKSLRREQKDLQPSKDVA